MKFTLSWLKDHLDTNAGLEEIIQKLTAIGLEVEGITDPSKIYEPFTVAFVQDAKQHPNADRLKICMVKTSDGSVHQVVCGAPNARAGMKGIFAPPGSYIPGTDLHLKKGNIRGEDSFGMLVSEEEMSLSNKSDYIIEVPDEIEVGTPLARIYGLDDPVIEIGLTPNRADCACVRGIARDLSAAGLGSLKPLTVTEVEGTFDSTVSVIIPDDPDVKKACPLFLGRLIKGVKNGPSPQWLQQRLKAVGLRPISALVDITNYLTIGLNRPLHVFDADTLTGDVHIRFSKDGETLDALNDKNYTLEEGITAVCDDSGVLGLGGIIGGTKTGCTDETTNVFLECACFDPVRTAVTGRRLQIDSDARYRFERGIDPDFTPEGMEIATQMILDLCGGKAGTVVTAGDIPDNRRTLDFDPDYTLQLMGTAVPVNTQKETLKALGFTVDDKQVPWKVTRPPWRHDIFDAPDIVDEIIRLYGFENIQPVSVRKETAEITSPLTEKSRQACILRSVLADAGLEECVSWSFVNRDLAAHFTDDLEKRKLLTLLNPISSETDHMRPTPLTNLLQAAKTNIDKGGISLALYEVGPGFDNPGPEGQNLIAAGLRVGPAGRRNWTSELENRPVDVFDVKADVMAGLDSLGGFGNKASVMRDAPDWYHPGKSGTFKLGSTILAFFGMIHPAILEAMDMEGPVAAFEIFPQNLPRRGKKQAARKHMDLPPLQPVRRDFAFIADESQEGQNIVKAVLASDKNLITDAHIFDVYQGKGIDPGKKSIAVEVTLQPFEKSLNEKDLEELTDRIRESVNKKTEAILRT